MGNPAAEVNHIRGRDSGPEDTAGIKKTILRRLIWGLPLRAVGLGITRERLMELQQEVLLENPTVLNRSPGDAND